MIHDELYLEHPRHFDDGEVDRLRVPEVDALACLARAALLAIAGEIRHLNADSTAYWTDRAGEIAPLVREQTHIRHILTALKAIRRDLLAEDGAAHSLDPVQPSIQAAYEALIRGEVGVVHHGRKRACIIDSTPLLKKKSPFENTPTPAGRVRDKDGATWSVWAGDVVFSGVLGIGLAREKPVPGEHDTFRTGYLTAEKKFNEAGDYGALHAGYPGLESVVLELLARRYG